MSDILGTGDFDSVRALIGADSETLTDETLRSLTYLDYVEIQVKKAFTTWATLKTAAGDDWTLLKVGTACLLAMRACSFMERGQEVNQGFSIGDYQENNGRVIDWKKTLDDLKEMAQEAFGAISTVTHTRPKFFLVSGPTSSGANVPENAEQWLEKVLPRILDWEEEGGTEDDDYVQ